LYRPKLQSLDRERETEKEVIERVNHTSRSVHGSKILANIISIAYDNCRLCWSDKLLQTGDDFATDVQRFEAILASKQPDLLYYCNELTSSRDCLQAIRSIRHCKYHIQLAEVLIAHRYAAILADRSADAAAGGGKTRSSAIVTLGSIALTAHPGLASDSAAAATAVASSSSVSLHRNLCVGLVTGNKLWFLNYGVRRRRRHE